MKKRTLGSRNKGASERGLITLQLSIASLLPKEVSSFYIIASLKMGESLFLYMHHQTLLCTPAYRSLLLHICMGLLLLFFCSCRILLFTLTSYKCLIRNNFKLGNQQQLFIYKFQWKKKGMGVHMFATTLCMLCIIEKDMAIFCNGSHTHASHTSHASHTRHSTGWWSIVGFRGIDHHAFRCS